jgi:metal-responsive CopG/Arc/MetJ family transcriptional regulator
MPKTKVAITLEVSTLNGLDRLVRAAVYPNRSRAIEAAVVEKLSRHEHRRLSEECAKLEPAEERALAEEGLAADNDAWPEY